MATYSSSGGTSAVPVQPTIKVSPLPRGDMIFAPGSNVAKTHLLLPGGTDGVQVQIIHQGTEGIRVYPLGASIICKDGGTTSSSGTTGGYIDTVDDGACITLRYVASGDGYWFAVAYTGTWTYA